MTLRDLSAKDVIQLKTGENLGRIDDVVFDEHGGQLQSVILRGRAHCGAVCVAFIIHAPGR